MENTETHRLLTNFVEILYFVFVRHYLLKRFCVKCYDSLLFFFQWYVFKDFSRCYRAYMKGNFPVWGDFEKFIRLLQ